MLRGAFLFFFLLIITTAQVAAQKCPDNIGFEKGNFDGWQCSLGSVTRGTGEVTSSPSSPTPGRQTLFKSSNAQELDMYGGFSIYCPNGSGHTVMLGNNGTGAQTEGMSYTFTIPPDQNNYSIVYHYAVVFQNPSGHTPNQMPRFTANVFDESSGTYIGCSSFTYTAGSGIPGFNQSNLDQGVLYKEWTPVTIKLAGYAGKTIRLEFNTYDCAQGGHFGYAYVDVNQNCSSPITGNVFCASTEKITLVAPHGFDQYNWYTGNFSQQLGDKNTLEFNPVPPANTKYALVVTPFPGQGCVDTLYTTATYSPEALDFKLAANVADCESDGVDLTAADITAGSGSNLTFSYFTNASLTKYVNVPDEIKTSGKYYVMAENVSGCTLAKPIDAHIEPFPEFTVTQPPRIFRPNTVDLTRITKPAINGTDYHYTYWYDSLATREIRLPQFVDQTGKYYIKATSTMIAGCSSIEPAIVTVLDPNIAVPNAFSPNGDGSNDEWRIPQLAYYPTCVVEVYNRTGRILYRSTPGYTKPWDGKFEGKELPVGTYYYILKVNDELPLISGSITIIR